MNRPLIKHVDASTGAEEERLMNDEEYEIYLKHEDQRNSTEQENIEKQARRNAILAKLGLTEQEAKDLLG